MRKPPALSHVTQLFYVEEHCASYFSFFSMQQSVTKSSKSMEASEAPVYSLCSLFHYELAARSPCILTQLELFHRGKQYYAKIKNRVVSKHGRFNFVFNCFSPLASGCESVTCWQTGQYLLTYFRLTIVFFTLFLILFVHHTIANMACSKTIQLKRSFK